MAWDLEPGDLIKQTELHARYSGGRQGHRVAYEE